MLRILISVVLAACLLGAAIALYAVLSAQRPPVQSAEIEEPVYNVDVFRMQPVSFTELLTAFGTAEADREVVVAAQVTGEIIEIHPALRIGQRVNAGHAALSPGQPSREMDAQVLLRIDARNYQARVEQAQAALANLRTEVEQLEQQQRNAARQLKLAQQDAVVIQEDYDRVRTLRERGAGSTSDLTRALLELRRYEDTIVQLENQIALFPTQLDAVKQRQLSAESDLQQALFDLQRTTVTPPFQGVLAEVMVEQGQFVRVGDPLVRLVDPDRIAVPVSIGMEDYLLIQERLLNSDFPRVFLAENETAPHRWTGNVVRVSPVADASSRTVQIFIEVMNADQPSPLLPGTFVFARIEGPSRQNALLVPRECIVDGVAYVVSTDGKAQERHVRTGRRLQSMAVVTEGLNNAEQVILTNLDVVRDGIQVLPQREVTVKEEVRKLRVPTIRLENRD